MPGRTLLLGGVALFTYLAGGSLLARHPQSPALQQPTFRTQTALVPLDVRVLDRNGRPITDLTSADFTIRENGAPQVIRHFAVQALSADADPVTDELVRVTPESPIATRNRRVFLIVLGGGRLQKPSMGLDAAVRFVGRLLPQDQVAILGFNRASDFTTNRESLSQVLERYTARHEWITTMIDECARNEACAYLLRDGRYPRYIQDSIDAIFSAADAPGVREVAEGRVTDAATLAKDARKIAEDLQRAEILDQRKRDRESLGLPPSPFEEFERALATAATGQMSFRDYAVISNRDRGDLGKLYTAIDYLRYIDGEKHLIYLTPNGMLLPRLESDFSVAAAANDARVAISIVQTGGHALPALPDAGMRSLGEVMSSTHMASGEPLSQRLRVSSIRTIANLTGGQASIYDFASKAFDRIALATSASYLLGYYPTDPALNGQYRRIEVQVNRPGAQVFYRHGYYARAAMAPVDLRRQMTYARIASAINLIRELRDLPIALETSEGRTPDGALEFVVRLTVDPARVAFVLEDGRHRGSLHVAVFCQDAEENPVGDLWQTITLNLSEATFEQMHRAGITHTARVRVAKPVTGVKVAVYDYASDRIGTVVRRVR